VQVNQDKILKGNLSAETMTRCKVLCMLTSDEGNWGYVYRCAIVHDADYSVSKQQRRRLVKRDVTVSADRSTFIFCSPLGY